MASKLRLKNRPPFLRLLGIPYPPEPRVELLALPAEFLPTGPSKKNEFPFSVQATVMGKPKKIKGVGSTVLLVCSLSFKSAEADNASLLGM